MKGFLKGVFSVVYLVFAAKLGIKIFNGLLPLINDFFDSADMNSPLFCIIWAGFVTLLYAGAALALLVFLLPGNNKEKSSPKSTTQSQRPAQAQTTRPATTHTAAARPVQAQTARPAATQPRPAQKPTPKPAAKPVNNSSKKIAADYVKAFPGALKGLIPGFILFFVFGLINDFTDGSNTLTTLAVLSLLICPIIGYISALNDQPGQRKLKANEQAHADDLEKSLKANLDILNQGCGVTQESISRYASACDNLVSLISWNFFDSRYKHMLDPYRHAVYERTWPVFNWRNGKYEVAVGEELADRLHNAIEKRANERKEEHERKMRQYK